MTYSVENIKIDSLYTGNLISATISGSYTQSLADSNLYTYTLSDNLTFNYSDAEISVYTWLFDTGTHSVTIGTSSNWKTPDEYTAGLTGSIMLSGIYDGTNMWVSYIDKMKNI